MATIRSLLNPAPEMGKSSDSEFEYSPKNKHYSPGYHSSHPTRKKQKICKDAAVFTRGPIRGECRYPPHEYQDEMLLAQHQQFQVYPMGEIADYPRRIPYNSEKKFFFERTGRDSLEVFQYNFKVPGDETQYAMLWDYNIGLVRTTPLFKCTGHSKTTPAKMLNRNPGLRDICHSITGGALVAQGYWMPYDAAKAVAATFCWTIRYALTPVFGTDFPAMCVPPDSEKFGDMMIDSAITKQCTEQANMYRELEGQLSSRPLSTTPPPLTPDTPTYPREVKQYRSRPPNINTLPPLSDMDNKSNRTAPSTPEMQYKNLWTPMNTPRSTPYFSSSNHTRVFRQLDPSQTLREPSSPELSPKSTYVREVDEDYDGDGSDDSGVEGVVEDTRKVSIGLPSDERAAYLLMSLRLQAASQTERRGKKRRAST